MMTMRLVGTTCNGLKKLWILYFILNTTFIHTICESINSSSVDCIMNAKPYYNNFLKVIQVNVTWNLQSSSSAISNAIEIENIPTLECENSDYAHLPYTLMNKTGQVTLFDKNYQLFFVPSCSYNIRFANTDCSLNYTISDCVGDECNCKKMSTPVTLNGEHLSENKYNLSWAINGLHKLKNVTFRVIHNHTDYTIVSNSLPDKVYENRSGYSIILLDNNLEDVGSVKIQGLFINDKNCKTYSDVEIQSKQLKLANVYVLILICSFIAVISIIMGLYKYVKRHQLKYNIRSANWGEAINVIYSSNQYEINRESVKIIRELDRGAFGIVYYAKLFNESSWTRAAAKMLRDKATEEAKEDFICEINTLKEIGNHPNIVQLLGYCTIQEPYIMVMEFIPCGSLNKYLLNLRNQWEISQSLDSVFMDSASDCAYIRGPDSTNSYNSSRIIRPSVATETTTLSDDGHPLLNSKLECVLDHKELQLFAYQIANGMAHLEKIPITHRDLAARNILIDENKNLKISDFGMSRTGPYINQKTKRIPLRWMAIESIEQNFTDSKSDVWSFGVVLWEIGTLGAFPYKGVLDQVLLHKLLQGHRLEMPKICTTELYNIMLQCWLQDPDDRPSFEQLVDLLDHNRRKMYTDFRELNPTYVFPPSVEN